MGFIEDLASALTFIAVRGLPYTFLISTSAFAVGLLLGVALGFAQTLGGLNTRRFVDAFVTVLRGIPPVLFLFIIFYGFPSFGVRLSNVSVAILGLGLISGAYQSQILRSSIETVSARQFEAALSIGLGRWSAFSNIVLPQALRLSLPGLVNEYTILVKDSSLAYSIGVVEMFTQADFIARARFDYLAPLTAVALLYLVVCFSFSQLVNLMYSRLRVLGYGQ